MTNITTSPIVETNIDNTIRRIGILIKASGKIEGQLKDAIDEAVMELIPHVCEKKNTILIDRVLVHMVNSDHKPVNATAKKYFDQLQKYLPKYLGMEKCLKMKTRSIGFLTINKMEFDIALEKLCENPPQEPFSEYVKREQEKKAPLKDYDRKVLAKQIQNMILKAREAGAPLDDRLLVKLEQAIDDWVKY